MADLAHITRRIFLSRATAVAAGAVVSTAAVAEAASPIFVKVGSPSMTVPPEVMAAIHEWKAAVSVKDAAHTEYQALIERSRFIRDNDPIREAWIEADDAATQAQWRLLRLLGKMA